MNFEVVDNVFQVTLLGSMAILSLIVALRRKKQDISAALWWLWMYVTGNFVLCALSDDHR